MGRAERSGSTPLTTAAALVCFAANSLLCRLALAGGHIDAASFTTLRLLSGAAMLALLARGRLRGRGSWVSAGALFSYAAPFSFAYLHLDAGTGALILFVAVQLTMIGWGIVVQGERPGLTAWLGLAVALGGLVGLAAPGVTAPDPLAGALMTAAGVAWGVYSLRGRAARADPLPATAANFALSVPMTLPLLVGGAVGGLRASGRGLLLAAASGALASGLGYISWYAALRGLSATRAAVLQLLVPILAALGGVALLGEHVTLRLVLSGAAILAGVGLTIHARA